MLVAEDGRCARHPFAVDKLSRWIERAWARPRISDTYLEEAEPKQELKQYGIPAELNWRVGPAHQPECCRSPQCATIDRPRLDQNSASLLW